MRATLWIAVNVFRESVRDRVLYSLVLFAVLMIGASFLIGQLTAGQDVKIIQDLGLAAIFAIGVFIAVFIGIGLVSKEVERKSIYNLLSKPVDRYQIVAGKYLGLVLTLAVNVSIMAAAFYAVLYVVGRQFPADVQQVWDIRAVDPNLLKAIALIFIELTIVTAIALFFSTFSTPLLSAALTLGLVISGHFSVELRNFEAVVDSPAAARLARGLYWLLPNLSQFDMKSDVVHGRPVPLGYMAIATGYAFAYILLLLIVAMFVFSRRDFK
jgi:ABC-type transport system involved in multi-copper enzyme maturation permease subunit